MRSRNHSSKLSIGVENIATDKYDIAAKIAVAELDGFIGRMPAKQQREIFGRNIFGFKQITIDASGQGMVYGIYSAAYGTDLHF